MHTYNRTYNHTYIHTHIHKYTHTLTYINTYMHTYISTHIYTYIHTFIRTYRGPSYVHAQTTNIYQPEHRLQICPGYGSFLMLSGAFNQYIRNNTASFRILTCLPLRLKARCLLYITPALSL